MCKTERNEKMPRISVIVPVYKVEKYIRRCIDSLLCQTFRDFELILVDDGSPDSSGTICEEYAQRDSRVHVIHQKNGGLSAARNTGIRWVMENSSSIWLTFVDSDDWVHPEMLEILLDAAGSYEVQISCCGFAQTDGEDPMIPDNIRKQECWEAGAFYQQRHVDATIACAKLYDRNLFSEVRYPEGRIHEDEFVTYRLLFECGRIAYIPAPLYCYYINAEGITKSRWTPKRLDALSAKEEQLRFFSQRSDQKMYRFCLRNYLETALQQVRELDSCPEHSMHKKQVDRKVKWLIRENNKLGQIHVWDDYECLCRYYPIPVQLYRVYNALRKKLGLKYDA